MEIRSSRFASPLRTMLSIRVVTRWITGKETIKPEDRPMPEIERLRPDICCKDDTYAVLPLQERATVEGYGGRMVLIPRQPGLSTTALAARMRGGAAS